MASETEESVVTCPDPQIDHLDRHGYLFGYPIAHSMSPLMHQTVYDAFQLSWSQLPLSSTDMEQFLRLIRHPKFYGASVTMPHKVTIIPHLDDITPEGKAVGACNTIFRRGTQMVGTNTDTIGVREALSQNVDNPDACFHNRPGLVIGGGGAARSAVFALTHFLKCPTVYLVNRDAQEVAAVITWCSEQGYGDTLIHVATVAQAESLEGCGAIVSCVPNFPPATEDERVARNITQVFLDKPHKGALLELCYHPTPWTEIAALAQTAGWQVILGTECVIYQGLEQDRLWTGKALHELPVKLVKEAIAAELDRATH